MTEEELYIFLNEVCGIGSGKPIKKPYTLYPELCSWLDNFWHDSNKFFCWGCFSGGAIEHHHMISVQECSKIGKPWLVIDPSNLIPLCNHCHHAKFHNGGIADRISLKCWDVIMDYWKENHNELYMKTYYKIEEFKR